MPAGIEKRLGEGGEDEQAAFDARVRSLTKDVPNLPNFSRFSDQYRDRPDGKTLEGRIREAYYAAYDRDGCEHIKLNSKEIDRRLREGPELVSANFVIPYPPGFPIMVPGQVISRGDDRVHAEARCQGDPRLHRGARLENPEGCSRAAATRKITSQASDGACRLRGHGRLDFADRTAEREMGAFFQFLKQNPFILLFFVVGLSVWVGKLSFKGYGLGTVAASIIVGCAVATVASTYGVKLQLDNFVKSLFYYLFMYGVGLRVGPSFVNGLKQDGIKATILAVVSCFIGLGLVVGGAKLLDLPLGAAGGMLAGSQTMSAAIGSAEQAVTSGVVTLPPGTTARTGHRR